jgi:hypothetical protein
MKYITYILLFLALSPLTAHAATKPWYQVQLELEAFNLSHYGNPFGSTGKSDELYDPITKLPWWRIQLDKEAFNEEQYGNPCGPTGCITSYTPTFTQNTILQPMPVNKPVETIVEDKTKSLAEMWDDMAVPVLRVWSEMRNEGGRDKETPWIFVQGTWFGDKKGELRCTTPDLPKGAIVEASMDSGKTFLIDTLGWKTGDKVICTLKVGDEESKPYEYSL